MIGAFTSPQVEPMYRYVILPLSFGVALSAQTTVAVTPFAAVDQSLSSRPMLLGSAVSLSLGPVALRAGGGVAHVNWLPKDTNSALATQKIRAFAADVDLVLNPGRPAGASGTFGSLEPRLFVGYGVRGEATNTGATETHNVVSVGSILSYSLLSRLRFDVEARRMVPANEIRALFDDSRGGWEYRAGFALHFGKGNMRPVSGILTRPGSTTRTATASRVVSPAAGTLLATADQQIGIPYVWGGTSPTPGFDCSGFVQYVFSHHGIELPRTSREMAQLGTSVGRNIDALRPGDLMFFAERDGRISHVAIYAGDNMILHSSRSGNGVGYDDLTTSRGHWYQNIFVGAQRVLGVPIQGVTMAGGSRGQSRGQPRALSGAASGPGISAFLRAAGIRDLSDVAKRLYRADETPDPPDGAPKRRW